MKFHWEAIQRLAKAHHCEDPVASLESFRRFLEFWWCRTYTRPLKDPILSQYTLDELTYEYLRHLYHEPDMDPRKELEAKVVKNEDDEWVKQMLKQVKAEPEPAPPPKPLPEPPEPLQPGPPIATELPDISTIFDE